MEEAEAVNTYKKPCEDAMKKVECMIPNKRFPQLEEALRCVGIRGMTVTDVKGFGNQQTRPESFMLLPKTKIEMYCADDEVETIVGVITNTCKTDSLGDGKVAVIDIQEMIRIRTGERGEAAV